MDKSPFLIDIGKMIAGLKEIDVAHIFGSFLESDEYNDIDVALLVSEKLGMDSYKNSNSL